MDPKIWFSISGLPATLNSIMDSKMLAILAVSEVPSQAERLVLIMTNCSVVQVLTLVASQFKTDWLLAMGSCVDKANCLNSDTKQLAGGAVLAEALACAMALGAMPTRAAAVRAVHNLRFTIGLTFNKPWAECTESGSLSTPV